MTREIEIVSFSGTVNSTIREHAESGKSLILVSMDGPILFYWSREKEWVTDQASRPHFHTTILGEVCGGLLACQYRR